MTDAASATRAMTMAKSFVAVMLTLGITQAFFDPADHPFVDLDRSATGCLNRGCDLCGADGCRCRTLIMIWLGPLEFPSRVRVDRGRLSLRQKGRTGGEALIEGGEGVDGDAIHPFSNSVQLVIT